MVAKASRADVEHLLPLSEFAALFGGYVLWNAPEPPTVDMPAHGLGVWGHRNVVRFRRILRERGALIERRFEAGPEQRIAIVNQDYRAQIDKRAPAV